MLGNRSLKQIGRAIFGPQHYFAMLNMWRLYPDFLKTTQMYLTEWGEYPCRVRVRTPMGMIEPTLYCRDDILTVNEIFCRQDYPCDSGVKTVVDIGSNIGISAFYFLTRNKSAKCYLFEPNPANIDRLKVNLSGYEERYVLSTSAVADSSGTVSFGIEPTGRYGGIGVHTNETISVECCHINDVLEKVLSNNSAIDVLKMDIEGAEIASAMAIDPQFYARIKNIYLEATPSMPLLPSAFSQRQYGAVVQLKNLLLQ